MQDTTSARPGRAYLVITIIYSVFLFYGSLIPLDIQPTSLGDAFGLFRRAMQSTQAPWSQSDMVTNIAMFIPLTFCAFGAWSRENRRSGRWWMAVAIFGGGLALSFALEFSQVFVPTRTVSVHDVRAQTIGNFLGLAAWMVFGAPLTRWIGGLQGEGHRPALCIRLLYTYAALFVLYSLLPFDLTISAGQVWHKYKAGMINLVPFRGPGELAIVAIAMKTALYIPIGYLLACRAGRDGLPLLAAVVGGVFFSACVESLQVVVQSRMATTTDVALGAVGAAAGGLLAWLAGPITVGQGVQGTWWQRWGIWLKLPAAAGWLSLMAYQHWGGFQVRDSTVTVVDGLGATLRAPLGSMVYSAGPLESLGRLAQEFGAVFILGMFLQALLASSDRWRLLAAAVGVWLVLTLELGRLWFSPYGPDMTLVMTGLAAVIASLWVHPRFVTVFLTPAAVRSNTSP